MSFDTKEYTKLLELLGIGPIIILPAVSNIEFFNIIILSSHLIIYIDYEQDPQFFDS